MLRIPSRNNPQHVYNSHGYPIGGNDVHEDWEIGMWPSDVSEDYQSQQLYFHLRWGDGRVCFGVVLAKSICSYINGHRKQYIEVDIVFNCVIHCGLPGRCLHLSPQNAPFSGGARKERCIFRTVLKTCSWKPKNDTVVKYNVYLGILLVGSVM